MKFHLNYLPRPFPFKIDHTSSVALVGSCFADNIGGFLTARKFNALVNPNGILFNPFSILDCLNNAVSENPVQPLIVERSGIFYSYLHHSAYSSKHKAELLEKIETTRNVTRTFLASADYLILTFGTAFIYTHNALDQTVANCHKQPAEIFTKRLLSPEEIVEKYDKTLEVLKKLNPRLKIIFTVSPVKYLKDGVVENNLSKATLLLSVHGLVSRHPHCFYFPAFELLNDDLRDYRFYKEDLSHPNDLALEYIWEKFSESFFSASTLELNQKIQKLNQALNHRTMQPDSEEALKLGAFIENQKREIHRLAPGINLD